MTCCSVQTYKKQSLPMGSQLTRLTDTIMDGIYFFGGVNIKGELSGKLKYLKPTCSESKVMSIEFQKLKQQGISPPGRTGHTMEYLPVNQSLLIVGGRNDELCKQLSTPFLNDMFLFLLD
eukprot:CAMPEP_0170490632 /NCGR_PEP_ID=MMETSP0208-20121228/8772_1 /TAXON_ID=197538 /ORGANISM="Strombidium inclinatum, Strain S3" /LENGTH=119 /DNA_ID=CAMNT_0010766073 /DNA_START=1639 /DNA_END=1998 /DNA_ORIENTATION=-